MIKIYSVPFKILVLAAVLSGFMLGNARAAIQGTLGPTSAGALDITVTKPPRANITSLSDMSVTSWTIGNGDQVLTSDVCVYSSRPNGGYTVKATGSGAGNTFALNNGANSLAYSVTWNAGGVGALSNNGTILTSDITSGGFSNGATDSSSCNGAVPGPTARLVVNISEAALSAIPAGTYIGTLTMLVTPN